MTKRANAPKSSVLLIHNATIDGSRDEWRLSILDANTGRYVATPRVYTGDHAELDARAAARAIMRDERAAARTQPDAWQTIAREILSRPLVSR